MNTVSRRLTALLFGLGCFLAAPLAFAEAPPESPKDGRTFLKTPAEGIGKYVGLLYFNDPRPLADRGASQKTRLRIGTAWLVSDRHIVTCAHCIASHPALLAGGKPYPKNPDFETEGFADKIYFAPGHSGTLRTDMPAAEDVQPYGVYRVVDIKQIFKAFFEDTNLTIAGFNTGKLDVDRRSMYDLVVLELDKSTKDKVGGHLKVTNANLMERGGRGVAPTELQVNGYDGDLAIGGMTLPDDHQSMKIWQVTRKATVELTLNPAKLRFNRYHLGSLTCKVAGGASGGPIWVQTEAGPEVVGITVRKDNATNQGIGLFFQKKHVDFIGEGAK